MSTISEVIITQNEVLVNNARRKKRGRKVWDTIRFYDVCGLTYSSALRLACLSECPNAITRRIADGGSAKKLYYIGWLRRGGS